MEWGAVTVIVDGQDEGWCLGTCLVQQISSVRPVGSIVTKGNFVSQQHGHEFRRFHYPRDTEWGTCNMNVCMYMCM